MGFLESSIYRSIVPSANNDNLTCSSPIHIPFVSFSCITALTYVSRTIFNRSCNSGHPCLAPDFF